MANVHYGGGDMFNALVCGETTESTRRFLDSQFTESMSAYASEAGERFYERARTLYDRARNSNVARLLKAASRKVKSKGKTDVVFRPRNIADLQHAKPKMQRWNMAMPRLRRLFHEQMCDGYSDSYVDVAPNDVGADHYDYRRATNGMVMDTDEGWEVNCYIEDLHDLDAPLSFEEQCDIQDSWDLINEYLEAGKDDPTSKFAALLN